MAVGNSMNGNIEEGSEEGNSLLEEGEGFAPTHHNEKHAEVLDRDMSHLFQQMHKLDLKRNPIAHAKSQQRWQERLEQAHLKRSNKYEFDPVAFERVREKFHIRTPKIKMTL